LELFALGNIAFLALDIYLAHSINNFAHGAEWVPVYFSIAATAALLISFPRTEDALYQGRRRYIGFLVGWGSVVVGISGMLLHLRSQFFSLFTIKSLVYTAPFVAPLAYTGIGLLLILNRMVRADTPEWGRWVMFLSLGGVVGNFVLTLCDHAQNGFFNAAEWIPVIGSAITIGFLSCALATNVDRFFLTLCICVLGIQGGIGLLGFFYHLTANIHGPSPSPMDNFLYGAPIFAPLLLPNISILGILGLWALRKEILEAASGPRASMNSG